MAKGKILCNVCGKPIDQICADQAVVSIHNRIGYGSKHDGNEMDLRNERYSKVVQRCKRLWIYYR